MNDQVTTGDIGLEQLPHNSRAALRSLFRRKGLSADDCDDLTQEVLLKFLRYQERIQPRHLYSYLLHIAATVAVDHSRRKSRREHSGLLGHTQGEERDLLERHSLPPLFDNAPPDPETALLQCARTQQLSQALGQLPERDRTILILHYLRGYSYAAIGETLHLSEKAVNMAALRACRKLKGILGSPDNL